VQFRASRAHVSSLTASPHAKALCSMATERELRRLLVEKQRECDLYIEVAANNVAETSAGSSSRLSSLVADKLDLNPRDDYFYDNVARRLDALLRNGGGSNRSLALFGGDTSRQEDPRRREAALVIQNKALRDQLRRRRETELAPYEASKALVPRQKKDESELTQAVAKVNYVFDELLLISHMKAKNKQASGRAPELVPATPSEHLEQWDALSGIMENQELRQLLAMGNLSLAESYEQIRLLFYGAAAAGGAEGKGGRNESKDKSGADSEPAPPVDRSKFEKFFIIRHLGLLAAHLAPPDAKGGDKKGDGGAEAKQFNLNIGVISLDDVMRMRQAAERGMGRKSKGGGRRAEFRGERGGDDSVRWREGSGAEGRRGDRWTVDERMHERSFEPRDYEEEDRPWGGGGGGWSRPMLREA